MWRSYFIVGVRALIKDRTYAFLNIVGLAIGLAACLMLLLYVRYERSYDEWLPNAENVYQLQGTLIDPSTKQVSEIQLSPFIAGETLRKDFPQIEAKVYAMGASPIVTRGDRSFTVEKGVFVDGNLFAILQVPFVSGDPRTALGAPGSAVLSRAEAQRLFGGKSPLGETLPMMARGRTFPLRITGVFEDLPRNSHQRLTMAVRMDFQSYYGDQPAFLTQWGSNAGWTYFRLRPGTDQAAINDNLQAWEKRNIPDVPFGSGTLNPGNFVDWRLTNVRDIHLGEAQLGGPTEGNDERTILTFAIIAVLILGMACVNFTNLATARGSARAREVALRKVLGASRQQLMIQFLLESILVAGIATLLASAMAELLLPQLGSLLKADLRMIYFGEDGILLPILLLACLVGVAGGICPAFYLSRFQPAQVLKANKSIAEPAGSGVLRNVLVISQFSISIGLIICTAVVYAQTIHARTADPGFRREGLLQVQGIGRRQLSDRLGKLVRELEEVPGVTAVTRTSIGVAMMDKSTTLVQVPGRSEPVTIGSYPIDGNFVRTMGIPLVAGRELTTMRPLDRDTTSLIPTAEEQKAFTRRGINIVVNERGARDLGFANPPDIVGKQFPMGLVEPQYGSVPVTVVGVVGDTRFRSIRQPVEGLAFILSDNGHSKLIIRYNDALPAAVRERVEAAWWRVAPDVPFEAEFSEDIIAKLYSVEVSQARIFAGFAILAVIIACLGLFGLAAFTAERRTKEIGIRKVLGARTRDIVRLLAWQFAKPVIVANLIAWPVAWLVMSRWVQRYDEVARVDIGVGPFLLAGLLALVIAVGTLSAHAIGVARANPIRALRYE